MADLIHKSDADTPTLAQIVFGDGATVQGASYAGAEICPATHLNRDGVSSDVIPGR